ncbi:TetR/AcrR family transcriptional regulator [Streptomyces sp. NPDC090306]|uniref:TetR/AcrR family transcriptional regulator n=1 Tax=unclassified Streptomyces TaxID=2593676 RepID=UPI0036EE41DC
MPKERVLEAAEALFADASTPTAVSMDDIAAAAGVGKGTLFRAFGSRDGLLDAVFAARIAPWRAELDRPGSPVGPDAPPVDRIVAVLGQLLAFKLENPRLTAARELDGASLLRAPHYVWVHEVLARLIVETGSSATVGNYAAHMLLGALRTEVVGELLDSGRDAAAVAEDLATLTRRLLNAGPPGGDTGPA